MELFDFVIRKNIQMPVKLEIGLEREVKGTNTRYFKIFINRQDVTTMVAGAINGKLSKAKDTYNCLIVHGCGMDMGEAVQSAVYIAAVQAGYKDMFEKTAYKYLGKRIAGTR